MSGLSLAKVSGYMTPKERAKLVINLQLKGLTEIGQEEIDRYLEGEFLKSKEISNQSEIKTIVAACPANEANEYNFYINLKHAVWNDVEDKICHNLTRLDILEGNIGALNYLISISPLIQHMIDELERTPVVVTKKEYEEGVKQIKDFERASVLQLEGRFNLAQEEAYFRLTTEGKIQENGDYLDGWLDYIDNFGKSEQEILASKVEEIKKSVEKYKKEKERLDGEEPPFSFFAKYAELSEEELRSKVKEDHKDEVFIPTQEEYDLWQKTVEEEKNRLLQAVNEGKLVAKDGGIEAGSYYDWPDRRQKFAGEEGAKERGWHPLREDCMEIGYSNGKVTSGGQVEGDWHQIVIATEFSENMGSFGSPGSIKRRTEGVLDLLKTMLPFNIVSKNNEENTIIFKFSRPEYEERIMTYVVDVTKLIKNTINCIAVIREIENKYFDGMSLFSEQPSDYDFSPEKVRESLQNTVDNHNNRIKKAIKLFNRTALGFWDFQLENIEQYLLSLDHEVDKEWVKLNIEKIAENARRN